MDEHTKTPWKVPPLSDDTRSAVEGSADIIGIYKNKFVLIDEGSMSLNIYSSLESDMKLLENITKRKGG